MKIALIWAMADDGVIGVDNGLPWKLPADMQWFRRHTLGKPIVMGRRTFESFGSRPLPQRLNIVISRDPQYRAEGVAVVGDIDQALVVAGEVEEVMVIGGASLYAQTLPLADRLYVTRVHANVPGDTRFPEVDWSRWREVAREERPADEKNVHALSFLVFERA